MIEFDYQCVKFEFFLSVRVSFWLVGAGRVPRRCAATVCTGVGLEPELGQYAIEIFLESTWGLKPVLSDEVKSGYLSRVIKGCVLGYRSDWVATWHARRTVFITTRNRQRTFNGDIYRSYLLQWSAQVLRADSMILSAWITRCFMSLVIQIDQAKVSQGYNKPLRLKMFKGGIMNNFCFLVLEEIGGVIVF